MIFDWDPIIADVHLSALSMSHDLLSLPSLTANIRGVRDADRTVADYPYTPSVEWCYKSLILPLVDHWILLSFGLSMWDFQGGVSTHRAQTCWNIRTIA